VNNSFFFQEENLKSRPFLEEGKAMHTKCTTDSVTAYSTFHNVYFPFISIFNEIPVGFGRYTET
jgi:hypothetical protein